MPSTLAGISVADSAASFSHCQLVASLPPETLFGHSSLTKSERETIEYCTIMKGRENQSGPTQNLVHTTQTILVAGSACMLQPVLLPMPAIFS